MIRYYKEKSFFRINSHQNYHETTKYFSLRSEYKIIFAEDFLIYNIIIINNNF